MKITIDEFKKEYLEALQNVYHDRIVQNITADRDRTRTLFDNYMDTFLQIIQKFQEYYAMEIGEIQISLLSTSMALGTPQFAFTAYDANGMFGEEILTAKFNAGWYMDGWEEYHQAITEKCRECNALAYIHPEGMEQMMRESISFAVSCLAVVCKYLFAEFEQREGYEQIMWADGFRLTAGSYRDWSKLLYRKTPEADIFWSSRRKDFSFCHFQELVYNKKIFEKIDLSHAHFYGCEFVLCKFEETFLRDAVFDGCRFYHCSMDGVDLAGATIRNSTLKKCKLTHMNWDAEYDNPDKIKEFYKPFEMLENVVEFCTNDGEEWKGV